MEGFIFPPPLVASWAYAYWGARAIPGSLTVLGFALGLTTVTSCQSLELLRVLVILGHELGACFRLTQVVADQKLVQFPRS